MRGLYIKPPRPNREQERAIARMNQSTRQLNREIARDNHRRRFCVEKILEWCIKGNVVQVRVWVTKLVSAGFSASDGAEFETMPLPDLERQCRRLLGLKSPAPSVTEVA